MRKYNITFIGGIHGVGKTTFCNKLIDEIGYIHYSASTLIRKYKEMSEKDKSVAEIGKNQDVLLKAVQENFDGKSKYILDGHFCLLNKNNIVERISKNTFTALDLNGIIVLKENVVKIVERLKQRDDKEYDKELIEEFQVEELMYSKEIAQEMKIPYLLIDNGNNISEAVNFVKSLYNV